MNLFVFKCNITIFIVIELYSIIFFILLLFVYVLLMATHIIIWITIGTISVLHKNFIVFSGRKIFSQIIFVKNIHRLYKFSPKNKYSIYIGEVVKLSIVLNLDRQHILKRYILLSEIWNEIFISFSNLKLKT